MPRPTVHRPPDNMSPVANALASITGSCSWGTITVVTSRTRSVHAASAPINVNVSGLSKAIRSPQHNDENGPSSISCAQSRSTSASKSGSMTGMVEVPYNADEATRKQLGFLFGGVIYDLGGALIALRPVAVDRFHEDRAGLDHIAFRVADKDELDSAAAYLDELGIDHEPVKDIGPSYILEFRDPDNIALELTAPK